MNESILPVTPGLLALLSKGNEGINPFTREIFLLEITIAGTTYCDQIEELDGQLVPEKVLSMKRDPDNEVDEFAIGIYCENQRIGWVPAGMNLVCSRLMDAGKLFFCRVISKSWKGNWLKIKANVYMVE